MKFKIIDGKKYIESDEITNEQCTDTWRQNRVKEFAKEHGLWGLKVGSEEYINIMNNLTKDQQKEIDDIYKPRRWYTLF